MAWSSTGVDLEVVLSWVPSAEGFLLNVLYNAPGDHDDYRYFGSKPVPIELETLGALSDASIDDYGVALGKMLFPDGARVLLNKAIEASNELTVHLRLVIDSKAPTDYQAIRWETLCHPGRGSASPRRRVSASAASCPRQKAFNRHLSRGPASYVRSSR